MRGSFGQARQAELVLRAVAPERRRVLPGLRPRIAEPHFEQRRSRRRPGRAEHHLAVARVDGAVARAARRQRNHRLVERVEVAEPVAPEHRHRRRRLQIDLAVRLVVVGGELLQRRVVVGVARAGRVGQAGEHLLRERRSPGCACRPDRSLPVRGSRTSTAKMPCRCSGVAMLAMPVTLRVWRCPS